jgi:REP element-mobilizing transposase RayT
MPRRKFFLHTISDVTVRTRGYLPHWELQGATYSLTFRLNGSLPAAVIMKLEQHRRDLARMITGGQRKLTPFENMDLRARFERDVDDALHEHHDIAYMNNPDVADIVANTLTYFVDQRYWLDAWAVMPNHVHAVITPLGVWTLAEIVHSWKSYSANRANELLGRRGRFWAREYFDRILRDEQDHAETIGYVLANPEKAGLRDWRWTSAGWKPADRPAGSQRSVRPALRGG